MDWALSEPIPWKARQCLRAATVHLGASFQEICASEAAASAGRVSERPFVILAQPSLFDSSRAPAGQHTAWAYCHVPNGYAGSALSQIEAQIERFAPGFRNCILARADSSPAQMQQWNENLIGGDINGGAVGLASILLSADAHALSHAAAWCVLLFIIYAPGRRPSMACAAIGQPRPLSATLAGKLALNRRPHDAANWLSPPL